MRMMQWCFKYALAVGLASAQCVAQALEFAAAKPVWPEDREKEWNCQVGFTAEFVGAAAKGAVLRYTGAFNADGVWRLANSNGGSALVGVAWGTFDSQWREASTDASCRMHTEGEGPDRKLKKSEAPPVAYSGDDWKSDLTKASTITFTPPEGSGLEPTTWNKSGRGASAFTFNKRGVWTVELKFANNTTRTAHIEIPVTGLTLVVK